MNREVNDRCAIMKLDESAGSVSEGCFMGVTKFENHKTQEQLEITY